MSKNGNYEKNHILMTWHKSENGDTRRSIQFADDVA